jgi:hypothetical protein
VKSLLAISVVILLLALFFFRVHSESGLMELQRCRLAVGQAKSWSIESISQPVSPNLATLTNRTKVSCPDNYEYFSRSRTPDDVIAEQSTIHVNGVTYVENVQGTWEKSATASDPPTLRECGKGPALVQSTVVIAIYECASQKSRQHRQRTTPDNRWGEVSGVARRIRQ